MNRVHEIIGAVPEVAAGSEALAQYVAGKGKPPMPGPPFEVQENGDVYARGHGVVKSPVPPAKPEGGAA